MAMTRTLILGGTAWHGREIAEQLVAGGEDVTCLARGESGVVPGGVTFVCSDRRLTGAYDAVKGSSWEEIIELAYQPDLVSGELEALAGTTRHWTLVSSVSVFASNSEPGLTKTRPSWIRPIWTITRTQRLPPNGPLLRPWAIVF